MNRIPSTGVSTWPNVAYPFRSKDVKTFVEKWNEHVINEDFEPLTLSEFQEELLEDLLIYLEKQLCEGKSNLEILQHPTFIKFFDRANELNVPLIKIMDTIHTAQMNVKEQFNNAISLAKEYCSQINSERYQNNFNQDKFIQINILSVDTYLTNK